MTENIDDVTYNNLKISSDGIENDKTEINDMIDKEKKNMLNKIFKMYPNLKTDQQKIMEACFKKKSVENEEPIIPKLKEEIVLEQFSINGKKYYKDKCECIWNNEAELIGIINGEKYILF
jgi:hypothetical protein